MNKIDEPVIYKAEKVENNNYNNVQEIIPFSNHTPFPEGEFKGISLCELKASYLLSLLDDKNIKNKYPFLIGYIKNYQAALRLEVELEGK